MTAEDSTTRRPEQSKDLGRRHRLAIYGSLAPGQPNHHQLQSLNGRWSAGTVRGRLVEQGWGAGLGYPALILDTDGTHIDVHVFESPDLPSHWERLDLFEGTDYVGAPTTVSTPDGWLAAFIYVLANTPTDQDEGNSEAVISAD